MLFGSLITIAFLSPHSVFCGEIIAMESRAHAAFPVPFELPNRNDRSEQCWLRVEDVELVETVTVYCYIAQAFLRSHVHDYNAAKMTEDDVDVSLWSEEPKLRDEIYPKSVQDNQKGIKDWKLTTVLDPITRMRLYVTQQATCRLVMYSREGMSNYQIDCEKILYYINDLMNGGCAAHGVPKLFVVISTVLLVLALQTE